MIETATLTAAVVEYFRNEGLRPVTEFRLPSGHRIDVAVYRLDGSLIGVEVKRDQRDFNRDTKWSLVMQSCFLFYFAVPKGFNLDLIHPSIRVIEIDGDVARVVRRTGKGLLRMSRQHEATGHYAVKPTTWAAPLRFAPPGDDVTLKPQRS